MREFIEAARILDPLGPERFHLEMEAARIGYAVRDKFVTDPGYMDVSDASRTNPAISLNITIGLLQTQRKVNRVINV